MPFLLSLARCIDALSRGFGRLAAGMVLLACVISAGNALARHFFNSGSNAWLEAQWHLLAGMVMLGAAHTLRQNAHVRVDVFYGRLTPNRQVWLDIGGLVIFLVPVCVFLCWQTWPQFAAAWTAGETSANAGGLPVWPAKLMLPLGFALLVLQGLAELIKRIAWLQGNHDIDLHYEKPLQ